MFIRASEPRPSTSWAWIMARRAGEEKASATRSHHTSRVRAGTLRVDQRPAVVRAASRTSRAACRCRACPCRRPGARGGCARSCVLRGSSRREAELEHGHAREPELVAQAVDGGGDDAEVLGDQRELAQRARARRRTARRPGPRCQRPAQRVARALRHRPVGRRSRGSGRCGRGRTARRCAPAARPTSGSRAAAAPASGTAGCPTAGPCP